MNPETATSYNYLGLAYIHKGEYDTAIQLCTTALEIWSEKYGEDHTWTAGALYNLGRAYLKNLDYEKSMGYLERAWRINSRKLGAMYSLTLDVARLRNICNSKIHKRSRNLKAQIGFDHKINKPSKNAEMETEKVSNKENSTRNAVLLGVNPSIEDRNDEKKQLKPVNLNSDNMVLLNFSEKILKRKRKEGKKVKQKQIHKKNPEELMDAYQSKAKKLKTEINSDNALIALNCNKKPETRFELRS
jgi:tetratricopeptide (TPR) repeat protein